MDHLSPNGKMIAIGLILFFAVLRIVRIAGRQNAFGDRSGGGLKLVAIGLVLCYAVIRLGLLIAGAPK